MLSILCTSTRSLLLHMYVQFKTRVLLYHLLVFFVSGGEYRLLNFLCSILLRRRVYYMYYSQILFSIYNFFVEEECCRVYSYIYTGIIFDLVTTQILLTRT